MHCPAACCMPCSYSPGYNAFCKPFFLHIKTNWCIYGMHPFAKGFGTEPNGRRTAQLLQRPGVRRCNQGYARCARIALLGGHGWCHALRIAASTTVNLGRSLTAVCLGRPCTRATRLWGEGQLQRRVHVLNGHATVCTNFLFARTHKPRNLRTRTKAPRRAHIAHLEIVCVHASGSVALAFDSCAQQTRRPVFSPRPRCAVRRCSRLKQRIQCNGSVLRKGRAAPRRRFERCVR